MNDDYTTDSRYLTYTFIFKRFGECIFLNLGVKGLKTDATGTSCVNSLFETDEIEVASIFILTWSGLTIPESLARDGPMCYCFLWFQVASFRVVFGDILGDPGADRGARGETTTEGEGRGEKGKTRKELFSFPPLPFFSTFPLRRRLSSGPSFPPPYDPPLGLRGWFGYWCMFICGRTRWPSWVVSPATTTARTRRSPRTTACWSRPSARSSCSACSRCRLSSSSSLSGRWVLGPVTGHSGHRGNTLFTVRSPRFWVSGYCPK